MSAPLSQVALLPGTGWASESVMYVGGSTQGDWVYLQKTLKSVTVKALGLWNQDL